MRGTWGGKVEFIVNDQSGRACIPHLAGILLCIE
jgi:hypothetical protein